ncbi:hypothetical protein TIFTF001_006875 [Ficus carica]|uniref:Uncharacterized protein n=1 Tax=Ficus carica TaxID=3494 RepID=A0AA88DG36_FICCA|nr:hypothetical protein TIFTF001_006875 [Ficus carica]
MFNNKQHQSPKKLNSSPENTCEARAIASFAASSSTAVANIHLGKRWLDFAGSRIAITFICHSPPRASVREKPSRNPLSAVVSLRPGGTVVNPAGHELAISGFRERRRLGDWEGFWGLGFD